jgi:acetolactate synthase-1/2/3 large subunit
MTATTTRDKTVAQLIARACVRRGVRRIHGLPGGGSCLDVIAAFAALDVPFVLARTEAAAGMMAVAEAEAGAGLGVVLTTQGPGMASVVNAVAQASLDRVPLLVITDGWTSTQLVRDSHQVIDQAGILAPLVKTHSRAEGDDAAFEIERLLDAAQAMPWGPVYLELTGENSRRVLADEPAAVPAPGLPPAAPASAAFAPAADLLASARRPLLLVGLEASRSAAAAGHIATLAARLGCPVLETSKAKGTLDDAYPHVAGLFTGGAAERDLVLSADLIVLCGFDPVELMGRPWPYPARVLDLGPIDHAPHYTSVALAVREPLAASLEALAAAAGPSSWSLDEIRAARQAMEARLAYPGDGLTPEAIVRIAANVAADLDVRATVDAGAHMFSAMAFWPARRRGDVLISNGLATMGFALPAANAVALVDPARRVIAFTGDGGLLMCLGELATAAQQGARVCVVVFNDSSLSLIRIKQQSRGMRREAVDGPHVDFAAVARGFGFAAFSASTPDQFRQALAQALASDGPSLVDASIDPSGYLAQSIALRG